MSIAAATGRIAPARLRRRPYLHLNAPMWDRLRDRLAGAPTAEFQLCRHDSRPGPDRPARSDIAVLEAAAFVAAVTGTTSDLDFLRLHLDMLLPSGGLELISQRRGCLLAAWAFCYDLLDDVLDEPTHGALRRTLCDQAQRTADEVVDRLRDPWPLEDADAVATLAGLNLAALAMLPEEPDARRWLDSSGRRLDQVLAQVGADGWWPTGFEDWNLLLPLLVRVGDAWLRLADDDRLGHPLFANAWLVALHGVAPGGLDVLEFDQVGRPGASRCQAAAEGQPGAHYRWRQEPCRWALARLGRRFPAGRFRQVTDHWRNLGLGRGSPFGVLWPDEPSGTPIAAMRSHHLFSAHGLAVWRRDWSADSPCLAFATGPAHGARTGIPGAKADLDADANHFVLWWGGEPLLIDTGNLPDGGPLQHNLVLVDGRGQRTPADHTADAATLGDCWLTGRGGVLRGAAGGCYPAAAFVRRFDRSLAVTPEYVLVWDHLHSARRSRYDWLLHTIGSIRRDDEREATVTVGRAALHVQVLRPARVSLAIRGAVAGDSSLPLGTALHVVGLDEVEQTQFVVALLPSPAGQPVPAETRLITGDGCVGARFGWTGGAVEEVLFVTRGGGIALDALRTDAGFVALRRDADGDWDRLLARGVTSVLIAGGAILTASQPVDAAVERDGELVVGEVTCHTGATVSFRCPFEPRGVLVDGVSGKARIDRAARRLSVRLGAGMHNVRVSGR